MRELIGTAVLLSMLLVLVANGSLVEAASEVAVDIEVNGRFIPAGGVIERGRTFADLSAVAQALDGQLLYDPDLKVAFVQTGRYLNLTWQRLLALNESLSETYEPIAPFQQGEGVRYGTFHPHITVATAPAGVIAAFEILFSPEEAEQLPWFDRAEAKETEVDTGELRLTRRMFVVDPDLLTLGGNTTVAFNGVALDIPTDAILWRNDRLYIRLRNLASASGGGVGWDETRRLATAKIVPGLDLTFDKLVRFNPEMAGFYQKMDTYEPGFGYRMGTTHSVLSAIVDKEGLITSVVRAHPRQMIHLVPLGAAR